MIIFGNIKVSKTNPANTTPVDLVNNVFDLGSVTPGTKQFDLWLYQTLPTSDVNYSNFVYYTTETANPINLTNFSVFPQGGTVGAGTSGAYKITITLTTQDLGYFSGYIDVIDDCASNPDLNDYITITVKGTVANPVGFGLYLFGSGPAVSSPTGDNIFNVYLNPTGNFTSSAWTAKLFYEGGIYNLTGTASTSGNSSSFTINGPSGLPDYEWRRDENGFIMGVASFEAICYDGITRRYNIAIALPHKPNPIHYTVKRIDCKTFELKYYARGARYYNVYVKQTGNFTQQPPLYYVSSYPTGEPIPFVTEKISETTFNATNFSLTKVGQTSFVNTGGITTSIIKINNSSNSSFWDFGIEAYDQGYTGGSFANANADLENHNFYCSNIIRNGPFDGVLVGNIADIVRKKKLIDISPNPSDGNYGLNYAEFIKAVKAKNGGTIDGVLATLVVKNTNGVNVVQITNQPILNLPTQIDISNQLTGSYTLQVVSGNEIASEILIKN